MVYKYLNDNGLKALVKKIKGANKDLNTPVIISTENTPESNAQNVKNIAEYVEKAKAAGVDTTKPFRITLTIDDDYPAEGVYDTHYSTVNCLNISDDGFAYIVVINRITGNVDFFSEIITPNSEQKVTSTMLDMGARRPIILTQETTEIDEETYQKLFKDDVDVVFKTSDGILCALITRIKGGDMLELYFTNLYCRGDLSSTNLLGVELDIDLTPPHKVLVDIFHDDSLTGALTLMGYIDKDFLKPVKIFTDNSPESMRKTLENLNDYGELWNQIDPEAVDSGLHVPITTNDRVKSGVLYYTSSSDTYEGVLVSLAEDWVSLIRIDRTTGSCTIEQLAFDEDVKSKQDKTSKSLGTMAKDIVEAINEVNDKAIGNNHEISQVESRLKSQINNKQNKQDNILETTSKEVVGAINELFSGGLKSASIVEAKLAQPVQDTLNKVGMNIKVLPEGTDLLSPDLEDGIWVVNCSKATNVPTGFSVVDPALLVVNRDLNKMTMFGGDNVYISPTIAVRHTTQKNWTTLTKSLQAQILEKLSNTAGAVGTTNLADKAVTTPKIADGAVTGNKLSNSVWEMVSVSADKRVINDILRVIKLTDNNTQNQRAINAKIAKLEEFGMNITNGYVIPILFITGNKEYHGIITAGKNSLLNGIVSDAQGQSYFSISVGATDGIVTFDENDPLVFKNEMQSSIDTLVTCVEFTKTTLSNKAHLDAYLAKLPNAKVMCCTYNGHAGMLHKINGNWYGVLVDESNTIAGQLSIKLQADGTIVEGTA